VNLWKAELQRLLSRRFVRILTLLLVAVFGITIFVTMASSRTPTADDWANATAQAQTENQLRQQIYRQCLAAHEPGASALERAKFPDQCELTEYQPEDFLYDTYVFHKSIKPLIAFLAAYLALFGFLIGATFVGAELSSGGMTNLLLWRPRRLQVLGAKLGVLLGSVGVFSVLFSAVYIGTFYGIAQATGYVGSVDSALASDAALLLGRGLALVLVVTACAFGVAALGRHTAASLGLATAYVVVWEGGGRLMMELLNTNRADPWFLSTYIGAWMSGRLELYDRYAPCVDFGGMSDSYGCSQHYVIYWWHAAVVFMAILAAFVGGAFVLFRRRDLAG
jgi:ABC-type transport system involved in multi-copper enzyme maturation permease subunit